MQRNALKDKDKDRDKDKDKDNDKDKDKEKETDNEEERVDVTECLICGKLFPRGPIDLARHGAAVTLKHVFSEKKSASFPFGCKKCTTYFSMKDHLEMHTLRSKCNPSIVRKRLEEAAKSKLDQQAAALKKLQKSDNEEMDTVKSNNDDDTEEVDSPVSEGHTLKKDVRAPREAVTINRIGRHSSSTTTSASAASSGDKIAFEVVTIEPKEGSVRQKAKLANVASAAASSNAGEFATILILQAHLSF